MTHVDTHIVPVFQFVSEKNDANFMSWAFNEWLKAGAVQPAEVTTDACKALQNSVCTSFNHCELEE